MSTDPDAAEGSDVDPPTSILRRRPAEPTGPATGVIRRHPTGALPVPGDAATTFVPAAQTRPSRPASAAAPSPVAAAAAATAGILNGWMTGIFATDLVTGWWRTDTLFSVAVAFLAAIVAACTIGGVVAVLLRRAVGRHLLVAGAALTLLVFGGIFLAGARVPLVVQLAPAMSVLAAALALLPATRRYSAL